MLATARQAGRAARGGLRRYAGDLRASRAFLASEVSHGGWLDLGQFRWHDATPGRAARAALGVVVPLGIGIATGHAEYGTFAALGAQPAGLVSFQGVTRSRVMLVGVAVVGMAVSTFVGAAATAAASWLLVPVIAAWAYVAGVCAALGPAAVVVSLQWPVAVLIASAIPLSPSAALLRAGLVLAGGAWQGVLVVTSWAVSRGAAERSAMAASYAALSQYAARLGADPGHPPPPPGPLPGTRALRDPNPLMRSEARRHLSDLMVEAERIRTTLAVVAAGTSRAGSEDAVIPGGRPPGRTSPGGVLAAAAQSLGEIAEAIRSGPADSHLEQASAALRAAPAVPSPAWAGESLFAQLRSAVRITGRLNDSQPRRAGRRAPAPLPGPGPLRPPARELLVTLRANLGTSSEAGRHALRLAVVTGLAVVVARMAGLAHAYWAALTALIVLRPDYGSTLYRGAQRAAGTLVGAGLGVVTVLAGRLGPTALLAGIGLALFAAFALLTVNYLFFSIFLTTFVVVELDLLGLPAAQTAPDRLIATALGTALALLAYILWPTWERATARDKFARLFLTQCRFIALLLRAWSRPGGPDLASARSAKVAARRERSGAETSADRITDEPERAPMTHEFAMALVSAGHRMALAALAVEAATRERHGSLRRPRDPVPSAPGLAALSAGDATAAGDESRPAADPVQPLLDELAGLVRQAGAQLAEALHRGGPPGVLPPAGELQARIPGDGPDAAALISATDSLADALSTTADVLRRYLGPQRGG